MYFTYIYIYICMSKHCITITMSRCDLQVLQHCAMAFTLQVVPTSKALQNGRQNSRSVHGMPNRNRLGTPSEHFSALSHCHTSIGFRTRWPQRCRCLPWSMVTGGCMTVWHRPRVGQSWFVEFHYGYRSICGYRHNRFFGGLIHLTHTIWIADSDPCCDRSDFETWYILLSGMSFCKSPEIRRNCCPCQTTKRAASQPQLKHATRMNIARQC